MSFDIIQKRSLGFRKVGRPPGSGRVPLTLDERRARNTECERERRVVMRDAINELAAAAGLRSNMRVADLLAEVVTYINTSNMLDDNLDIDELRQCNDDLAHQIAKLEHRLATVPAQPSVQPSSGPMKRKAEGCGRKEWPNPPPKRMSPDMCVMDSSDSERHVQASEVRSPDRLSFGHRAQPETTSCRLEPAWTPQTHTSCRQLVSVAPLPCREDQLSPVSCVKFSHSSSPSRPSSPYCVTVEPNVNDEDLADMTTIWTEALDVAVISRLSLSQMDLRATEQELVELYLL